MKSRILLKILLPVLLFVIGNNSFAQINAVGPLVAVNTTYGTASATTTFTLEGVGPGFTQGILVAPPSGYEVRIAPGAWGATVTAPWDGVNAVPLVTIEVKYL